MKMHLVKPTKLHIAEMMNWFPDEKSLFQWSGPNFKYPYDLDSFTRDLKLRKLGSYSLVDEIGSLVAFGQFYLRLKRCHLGRLVVSPTQRDKGIGRILISQLSQQGCQQLTVDSCSLFVLSDNRAALKLYTSCGFIEAIYPEKISIENCLYLICNQSVE